MFQTPKNLDVVLCVACVCGRLKVSRVFLFWCGVVRGITLLRRVPAQPPVSHTHGETSNKKQMDAVTTLQYRARIK